MKRIFLVAVCLVFAMAASCFARDIYLGGMGDDLNGDTVRLLQDTDNSPWYHYVNEKYGFAIDVPSTVHQADETSAKDGCTFYDAKKDASFIIYGTDNFMKMSLQELYNIDMSSNNNPTLAYKQFGPDWYGIAWEKGKMTYYKKVVTHGSYYNSFAVTYPTADKAMYQAIIQHMNATFVAKFDEKAR